MYISVFTDELGMDALKAIPIIKSWGVDAVDFRGRVFGKGIEFLDDAELKELHKILDDNDMRVGCLQSSLAKVHLPDDERRAKEAEKLEGLIRAADALDCRLIRSFHFWQPKKEEAGQLAVRPDVQQLVLDAFAPLAKRAKEAKLIMAFENCGVLPDEVFTMLDMLDVPEWGMAWDVANTWDCDERTKDEDAFIERMIKRTLCVHVKAGGAVQGVKRDLIPYGKVMNACHALGLPGPVSAETHNPDNAVSNVDRTQQVVESIRRAWPAAATTASADEASAYKHIERKWADNPVGFAVVGLGMGHENCKKVVKTPGCKLIGVCDLVEDRAKRSGDEFDVPYNTDFREWLTNDEVEVVYVVTETGNHAAVALEALKAGKHVLTTKPMEATTKACDEMIAAAEKNDVLLAVDFNRRFREETATLKQAVADGAMGKLLSAECSTKILRTMAYFETNGGWRGTKALDGGGVLSNQVIHHIDELVYCIGMPEKVRANVWTQNHEIEAEDLAVAAWLYEDGLVVNLHATTCYPQPTWYLRIELTGDKGAFAHVSGGPYGKTPIDKWYLDSAWTDKAPKIVKPEWLNAADNIAAAIRSGAALVCDGRDGRRSRAVLDAMYRSAYENGSSWVTPERPY